MRWFILILMFFGAMISFADKSIGGLAAVPIMEEFNLSYVEWGLVGSCYYWLYPVTGPFGASWADRIGPKKVLGFLMISWSILQFGVLAIAALPFLLLYRVLLGAFGGPYSPIAYSHLDKWFAKEKGLSNSAIVGGGTIGAMVIAPVLVSLITIFGWKVAFAFLGVVSLIWFFLFQFFTKESPIAVYKNEGKKQRGKLEKFNLKDFVSLMIRPTPLFTVLAYASVYMLIIWFTIWCPIYLVEVVQLSAAQMGYSIATIGIASIVIYTGVSMISDYLFKKNQDWRISRIYVVTVSMAIGALFLASIIIFPNPIWVVSALCLSISLTYAILVIAPTIMINEKHESGGLMSSMLTSFGSLAGIVAPVLTGYIISLAAGDKIAGYNFSVLFMAALVLTFGIIFGIFVKPVLSRDKIEKKNISNEVDLVN